jgi:Sulfatase-modifying factor enzyme 1
MRAGLVGAVLVVLGGGAAGGAVFLRDNVQLKKAQQEHDAAQELFAKGDLDAARVSYGRALVAAEQVGAATGKREAASEIEDSARRWSVWLATLRDDPRGPLQARDAQGQALGTPLPADLTTEAALIQAELLLTAGLALEESSGARGDGVALTTRVFAAASDALEGVSSERVTEAQQGLQRARLRQSLLDAELALRAEQDAEAARLAAEAEDYLGQVGEAFSAEQRDALRARLERVGAEVADRQALNGYADALRALFARASAGELGALLAEVTELRTPTLRGGHPGQEAGSARLTALGQRREHLVVLAERYRGMVLATSRGQTLVLIDRTEVTNADYQAFMRGGGYTDPAYWPDVDERTIERWRDGPRSWPRPTERDAQRTPPPGAEQHPVSGVCAIEAEAFARWRGEGVRLPTHAEWKAAGVGSARKAYPWGDAWRDGAGNVHPQSSSQPGEPEAVGSHPSGAGPTGAVDLIGNVREIVRSADGRDDFLAAGGSYATLPADSTVESTIELRSTVRASDTGFRCVRELEQRELRWTE